MRASDTPGPLRIGAWCLLPALLIACQPTQTPPEPDAGAPKASAPKAVETPEPKGHAASALRVVAAISDLETSKDVTCWTSFRQLDFFVATKEVSAYATLTKIAAIKSMTRAIWVKASASAADSTVDKTALDAAASIEAVALPEDRRESLGALADDLGMKAFTDYRKTSEHWRVVLALVQDEMRHPTGLKPLSKGAEDVLAEQATRLSLELLVVSGERATVGKSPFIEARHVREAHTALSEKYGLVSDGAALPALDKGGLEATKPVTGALIEAKIGALRHYNKSAGSVTADLQRISKVPLDEAAVAVLVDELREMARFVAEGREPMRADNHYLGRRKTAGQGERDYIDAVYVENTIGQLFPHAMMANGDIALRYEPNPGAPGPKDLEGQDIRLLDHQMNAVRDSAIHWVVLGEVYDAKPFAMDPFAAEMLTEALSMVMTLSLRRAQTIARQLKLPGVTKEAAERVRTRAYVLVPPRAPEPPEWDDASKAAKAKVLGALPESLFEDVTATSGLPTTLQIPPGGGGDIQTVMGAGIGVGDLNGDGYTDLFLAGEGLGKLYMNRGKAAPGQFEDKTAAWKVPEGLGDSRAALFFDREGDGDLDLLIVRSRAPSLLLDNNGGVFSDVAASTGLKTDRGAHAAAIFDADGDGDLDIYIGYYGADDCNRGACPEKNLPSLDGLNGTPNQLWRQGTDGTYTEDAARAGLDHTGWTLAATTFDHDGDGDLDLHIANDFGANAFFEYQKDGVFKDVSGLTGTADRGSGMNVSVSDVNGDGAWDFYITNIDMFSKNIKVVFPTDEKTIGIDDATLRSFRYISGNKLYIRQKGGRYTSEEQTRFEPGDRGWSWAGVFFDLENDGDEDLYLSNGWIEGSYAHGQKNQLFIHDSGRYFLSPPNDPAAFEGNSRSVVAADLDRDGRLDLVVNNFRQAPVVLRGVHPKPGNWIGLRLEGQGKNTRAIGAQIEVKAGGKTVRRQISCGSAYLGQQDGALVIGIGDAREAKVTVRWPDGAQTAAPRVRAGQWAEVGRP